MSMIPPKPAMSKPRELVPAGVHLARLYQIIHIGTSEYMWQGKPKSKNEIRFTFELPNEMREFENKDGVVNTRPLVISSSFNYTMGSKSNMRPFVEGILGVTLTDDEAYNFDIEQLIGKPVMLTVVHETKGDKTFANIKSVSPVMKGLECPPAVNDMFILNYGSQWSMAKFESLPDFIREKMITTPEYLEKTGAKDDSSQVEPKVYADGEINPDDIPF